MGAAARPGAGDDVRMAVVVDVGGRDEDGPRELGIVREEAVHLHHDADPQRRAVEDLDMGAAAGARRSDEVGHPVPGHVADR